MSNTIDIYEKMMELEMIRHEAMLELLETMSRPKTERMGQKITVSIKLLSEDAKVPVAGSVHSAGYDVAATERVEIAPGESSVVPIGLAMAIEHGYCVKFLPRSSHGFKKEVIELAGLIDSDYRGEVKIKIKNLSAETYIVEKGERFAQMLVLPTFDAVFETVDDLSDTERGVGGFGSTGR